MGKTQKQAITPLGVEAVMRAFDMAIQKKRPHIIVIMPRWSDILEWMNHFFDACKMNRVEFQTITRDRIKLSIGVELRLFSAAVAEKLQGINPQDIFIFFNHSHFDCDAAHALWKQADYWNSVAFPTTHKIGTIH